MEIKHKIVAFDKQYGTILVKYYTDEFPEGFQYNIDLPIQNGNFPTKDEIDGLINLHKPEVQIQRVLDLKNQNLSLPEGVEISVEENEMDSVTKALNARGIRDYLLMQSDFSQMSDYPISDVDRAAWAKYRQELRDLPTQEGFPDTVIFPVAPNAGV